MLRRHRASPEVATKVRAVVDKEGVLAATKTLNSSRETLIRVCAGMCIRPGSLRLIEDSIAKLNGHYEPRYRADFDDTGKRLP